METWVDVFKDILCGTIGGVAGIIAGQPLDTVKVRLQTQVGNTYTGPLDCIRQIVSKEGTRGFFKGTGPPILGNMPINALVFASYGEGMRYYSGAKDGKSIVVKPIHHFISGSFAGLVQSLISSPSELVKIIQQVDSTASNMSAVQCAKTLINRGGFFFGLYRGFIATVCRDVDDFLSAQKRRLHGKAQSIEQRPLSYREEMAPVLLAGGVAGVCSWIVRYRIGLNYPFDVLKSTRQMSMSAEPPPSMLTIALEKVRGGYSSAAKYFFSGLGTALVRAFPVSAVVFVVYESSMIGFEEVLLYCGWSGRGGAGTAVGRGGEEPPTIDQLDI